jgi:DNA-directed RNA polymerase III subunit RPC1
VQGVHQNLCTPKNGEILIAATQDFLTAAYLLTSKDRFFDRAQFTLLCSYMGDALEHIDLPTPTVLRPMELWTVRPPPGGARAAPHAVCRVAQGKQLFSVLVRPNVQCGVFVNLELEEKAYTRQGREFCLNDGCARHALRFRSALTHWLRVRPADLCAFATASSCLGAWAR